MATLRNRLDALEAKAPAGDTEPFLILRTFVAAENGKPAGGDNWGLPPPNGVVWISDVKYDAEPGETAVQAAERIAKHLRPRAPHCVHVAALRPAYGAIE